MPSYLLDLIPKSSHTYKTRSLEDVATLYSRTDIFKYSFFPSTISEWNKLDLKIRQSKTLLTFPIALIKIGRPIPKPIYNAHNPVGSKWLTRLRLGLSHLNQHKFGWDLVSVISINTSSITVSKIVYIQSVRVVWRLNLFPISFCTVIITQTYVQPS